MQACHPAHAHAHSTHTACTHSPATRVALTTDQVVDKFNNMSVTAFVTPGNARFLLLHEGRSDDSIRAFFTEVYELYLRVRAGVAGGRAGGWIGGAHT